MSFDSTRFSSIWLLLLLLLFYYLLNTCFPFTKERVIKWSRASELVFLFHSQETTLTGVPFAMSSPASFLILIALPAFHSSLFQSVFSFVIIYFLCHAPVRCSLLVLPSTIYPHTTYHLSPTFHTSYCELLPGNEWMDAPWIQSSIQFTFLIWTKTQTFRFSPVSAFISFHYVSFPFCFLSPIESN